MMAMQPSPAVAEAVAFLVFQQGLSVIEVSRRMDLPPKEVSDLVAGSRKKVAAGGGHAPRTLFKGEMVVLVDRDPCVRCGVRKEAHDENGCRGFRR